MQSPEFHRDIGRHDAQIEALERDVKRMREEMHEMRAEFTTELRAINATLSEARGGWKTLMMVGGASATIGALAHKLSSAISWLPK